jgi:hypothetical protein
MRTHLFADVHAVDSADSSDASIAWLIKDQSQFAKVVTLKHLHKHLLSVNTVAHTTVVHSALQRKIGLLC